MSLLSFKGSEKNPDKHLRSVIQQFEGLVFRDGYDNNLLELWWSESWVTAEDVIVVTLFREKYVLMLSF